MKLATLQTTERDGRLVIVSRDLSLCCDVGDVAPNLQTALDNWNVLSPRLNAVYEALNNGKIDSCRPFNPHECSSPLPRAYQFLDGSSYLNHVELVRKARGAEVPRSFYSDPLMYQGCSDSFLKPVDTVSAKESWGIDFEAEIAVITSDVRLGATVTESEQAIRLVMLMNDISMRELLRTEITKELGFIHAKPPSAFSPVAVTPDELGDAWKNNKVCLPLRVHLNGELFGFPDAGKDMNFDFAQLIAHAATTRKLAAGTILGGGTVSNKQNKLWGSSVANGGVGYCCVAEVRMYESIELKKATTPFMQDGDIVEIEMLDFQNKSIFGCIESTVRRIEP